MDRFVRIYRERYRSLWSSIKIKIISYLRKFGKITRFLFPSRSYALVFAPSFPLMHYELEITLEYPTHTYECIKGTGGGMDSFSIFQ